MFYSQKFLFLEAGQTTLIAWTWMMSRSMPPLIRSVPPSARYGGSPKFYYCRPSTNKRDGGR